MKTESEGGRGNNEIMLGYLGFLFFQVEIVCFGYEGI